MPKVPQSGDDLRRLLVEQTGFMNRSASAYDAGFLDEAKRLAVSIRVLVHDTAKSTSLLTQLGEKERLFYDTAVPNDDGNLLAYGALVQMALSQSGAVHLPYLDDPLPDAKPSWVPFQKWWARIIFVNPERLALSRKDLVLAVANQDGGAHVDPSLDEPYAKLREASLGWVYQNEASHYRVRDAELAAVRQIAHEVLKTFDPSIELHPAKPAGSIILGRSVMKKVTEAELAELEKTGHQMTVNPTRAKIDV